MNTKNVREALKQINRDFADAYNIACDNSRRAAMERTKPGSPAPGTGILFTEAERKAFDEAAFKYREKARAELTKAKNELHKEMALPPSSEATAVLSVLNTRTSLTREELEPLFSQYGDNYLVYKALSQIAANNKIYFDEHPLEAIGKGIESAERSVNRMTLASAERGSTKAGALGMFDVAMDFNFPDE